MILGIGIDIVETARMANKAGEPGFISRFMHPDEIASVESSNEDPAMLYASRFAAKEAFGKALGTGLRGIRLRDIAVGHDSLGRPELVLYETALKALRKVGGERVHISISHQATMAAAVVVMEADAAGRKERAE